MPARAHCCTRPARPPTARLWIVALALLSIAACEGRRREPAERAIAEIEAALADAGTAPAKYIPGQLADVRGDLDELEREYAAGRYRAVLDRAPRTLAAARALAPSAAARAAELDRTLHTEWATLSQAVPIELSAVAGRFDRLAARRKLPSGVTHDDVQGARGRLRDALALWDRARLEADAGRLPEAVTLAHQVRAMGRSVNALSSPPGAADVPVE